MVIWELTAFHATSFTMKDQCPERFRGFENLDDLWPDGCNSGAIYTLNKQIYQQYVEKILDKPKQKCDL